MQEPVGDADEHVVRALAIPPAEYQAVARALVHLLARQEETNSQQGKGGTILENTIFEAYDDQNTLFVYVRRINR